MLKDFLGALWRHLPAGLRRHAVRFGHKRFTASAGAIVLDDQGRVLLLDHVFRPQSGWGLPGGFLNRGDRAGNREPGVSLRAHTANTAADRSLFSVSSERSSQTAEF